MQSDDDLRARFHKLADRVSSTTPEFHSVAGTSRGTRSVSRPWYALRRLAVAGASLAAAMLFLAVGLVWGTSTGYASARVQSERERNEIAATAGRVTNQLATLRLELTRTRAGLVELAAKQGASARTSLLAAEAEVDSMTANVARIEHNVSTAGSAPSGAAFAILRAMPVRTALAALSCSPIPPVAPVPRVAALQQGIPVIDLPAATTRAPETFGGILGVRQAPDGKVLVNDARRRQLRLFDSTLTTSVVVRDSMPGSATSYGRLGTPLIPFLGDSSLIAEWNSQTMLLLDPHGQVVRAVDLPGERIFGPINSGYSGIDSKGRIIMRGAILPRRLPPGVTTPPAGGQYPDSLAILRVDLDQRRVDTIGQIRRPVMKLVTEKSSLGKTSTLFTMDPLQSVDEFAVTANGSVAFVRGHDYHIDWLRPDGDTSATPKLPFTWKRRSDADKARLADSVRAAQDALLALGYPMADFVLTQPGDCGNIPAGGSGRSGNANAPPLNPEVLRNCVRFESNIISAPLGVLRSPLPPLAELNRNGAIEDYEAPIRPGSTLADLDGNLWILPRTTMLSRKGELVYDVVNAKGELFERVRLPLGRAIAGFAKGGVVYLTSGDITNGFTLERTKLAPSPVAHRP